jgi:integrase/recombinase XerD
LLLVRETWGWAVAAVSGADAVGSRYWTVLDEAMDVVPVADRYLRELRFGRDRAESTTKSYAGGIALFLRWCAATGRDWREAADSIGLFMTWLKYTPAGGGTVMLGPRPSPTWP